MLRQASINRSSGIGDIFLQTPRDQTTGDIQWKWPFVFNGHLQVMGYGIAVAAFTGTSVVADVKIKNAGNPGNQKLIDATAAGPPLHTKILTSDTLTAVGWRAYRAQGNEPLTEIPADQTAIAAVAEHSFDNWWNCEVGLDFDKTSVSLFDGYGWIHLRCFEHRVDDYRPTTVRGV